MPHSFGCEATGWLRGISRHLSPCVKIACGGNFEHYISVSKLMIAFKIGNVQ